MVTTPRREEWCEHCLHPIDPNELVLVEAYKLVGDLERKVYFHDRCFNPANPRYFDALKHYSDDDWTIPIDARSLPAAPRAARSRVPRRLRGKAHRPRRQRKNA
jgi:hypothetical protein